jgi:hypothetical protein
VQDLRMFSYCLAKPKMEEQQALDLFVDNEDYTNLLTKYIAIDQLIKQKQTEDVINKL